MSGLSGVSMRILNCVQLKSNGLFTWESRGVAVFVANLSCVPKFSKSLQNNNEKQNEPKPQLAQ